MKVKHSEETYDSSLEIKKDFGKIGPLTQLEFTKPEAPKPQEPVAPPEPIRRPEPVKPPEPVKQHVPEPYLETKNEDLITDSISTKSSLDFFKNIIKENEEEKRRYTIEPKPEPIKLPKAEPFKLSSIAPVPTVPVYLPVDDFKLSKEVSSISQSFSESYSSFQKDSNNLEGFVLEPGPPPEIGYMPKSATTKPKEEVAEKAKKLTQITRQLSEVEAPSGGVRIFPVVPPSHPPVAETKKFETSEERREERREVIKSPVLRPAAVEVPLRPASPRPSAEGVAMERLWTTKLEHKPTLDRPKSPLISAEGAAMDKMWSHKHSESSLSSVWPPPASEQSEAIVSASESFSSPHFSEVKSSSFHSQAEIKSEPTQPFIFQPKRIEPPKGEQKIIYVAEAHASHRTTIPTETVISQQSGFYESSQEESSQVVAEKILLPSEAKKIWPPGLPVQPEPAPIKKPVKIEPKPFKSTSIPQGLVDIPLEPCPPPEFGFATPPPKERRTSYVEQIEQDLEKDLEKEPSRHLPGAIRTMPPPKRETSVESTKTYQRSNSMYEESSTRSYMPHKYSTVPRPSKFVKKSFESDYESDLEGTKIKARWTPWDSDTEEPTYRKVKPPVAATQPPRPHSAQPAPVSLPVFKPIAQPRTQAVPTFDGKRTPHDSGYMADTDEPRTVIKKTQLRSDKVFQTRQEKFVTKQERKIEKKVCLNNALFIFQSVI